MNSGLCEHCLRVAYLVTDMTILLGMDEKATMDVQLAAIYHDIGKTQIPEQVQKQDLQNHKEQAPYRVRNIP